MGLCVSFVLVIEFACCTFYQLVKLYSKHWRLASHCHYPRLRLVMQIRFCIGAVVVVIVLNLVRHRQCSSSAVTILNLD
jgi:hypothetical protein